MVSMIRFKYLFLGGFNVLLAAFSKYRRIVRGEQSYLMANCYCVCFPTE